MKPALAFRAVFLWSFAFFAFGVAAHGQVPNSEPSVHLSKAQAAQFQTALDGLAAQGKVALVAEGVPRVFSLKSPKIPDLTQPLPLSQVVAKIAAAYDYDAALKNGVFVFTKRYSDPRDLPDVTLDECRHAVAEVQRMMEPFNPHVKMGAYENDVIPPFIASLSLAQEQAMQNRTLHFGDLNPAQQMLIRQAASYFFVGSPAERIGFQKMELAPKSKLWPVADLYSQTSAGLARQGVERGLFIETPAVSNRHSLGLRTVQGNVELFADVDRGRVETKKETNKPAAVQTLAQVVADISRKEATPWEVDKALASKRVSVAGLENAPALDIMRALVQVYGLHIGVGKNDSPRLNFRAAQPANDLRGMVATIWAVIPDPVQRACLVGKSPVRYPLTTATMPKSQQEFTRMFEDSQKRDNDWQRRPQAVQGEAVKRLALALPLAWAKSGDSLPVVSISDPARNLLGLVLLCQIMDELQNSFDSKYSQPVTQALSRIDDVIISGNPQQSNDRPGVTLHSLFLAGPDANGKMVSLGGIGF